MDQPAYYAYTPCIILTRDLIDIDPSSSFMCIRSTFGRLVRSQETEMGSGFDPEALKAQLKNEMMKQLKEEMAAENLSMLREMMGEITKLIRENQPAQPTTPIDLDAEIPIREREEDNVTVLANPVGRRNIGRAEEGEQPGWAKDLTKAVAQMQVMMKEKGTATPMDYTSLILSEEDDPMPQKFKFPNMKKFSGTDDPHLHLKQYATYMKATGLSSTQIIK